MRLIEQNELKRIELDILDYVAQFCDDNNITYYLCGGTMLGALRHNGFIPWDDDIDIMMMRDDYERFISQFPSHDYYKVLDNRKDRNYPFAFATVNDTRTVKVEKKLRPRFEKSLCVNVDVFPIDTLPTSDDEIEHYYKLIAEIGAKWQCATYRFGKGKGFWRTIRKNIGILVFRTQELLHLSSVNSVISDFCVLAQRYNGTISPNRGITSIAHYGSKEKNILSDYKVTKHLFENKEYNIMVGYNRYLNQLYGNYMEMPPIEMQKTHHVSNCFWR